MAGVIILLCTGLLILGIKESANFTNLVTTWNICLIIMFIVAGAYSATSFSFPFRYRSFAPLPPPAKISTGTFYVDKDNWSKPCENHQYDTHCDHDEHNSYFPQGFRGVVHAAGILFFSYVGFDAVSCMAEETKNPRRDMVLGIMGTLGIATSLYIGVAVVLMGMIPFTDLDKDSPLADAFTDRNNDVMSTLVSFGAVTCTAMSTLTGLIGQPRIFCKSPLLSPSLFLRLFVLVCAQLLTVKHPRLDLHTKQIAWPKTVYFTNPLATSTQNTGLLSSDV